MRLLVADHDRGRAKGIAEACTGRGHIVEVAQHGATALELSLERIPEAVICPIDLAVIDGVRLAEILRGNPRTRGTSFIFLVNDELDAPISMDSRDATVVAPWHEADVLDHVDAILERSARFGEIRSDTEIEGKLSQISIADLLQIFQMNQRSGSLKISYEELPAPASIAIRSGQVVDALIPLADGTAVVGEKALYRVLCWKEGRFEFIPGEVREQARVAKPLRMLLMEGMRQKDEWDKLRRDMPGPDFRLALRVPREQIPSHTHPLTREVLDAVNAYRKIGEIVDHCPFPDYQVLRVLSDLFSRDFLGLEHLRTTPEGGFQQSEAAIFSAPQVRRMREWAAGQRPKAGSVLKVVVASKERALVRAFVTALRESTHFVIDGRLARDTDKLGALGTLGHVPLGEHMTLRLISAPADAIYEPLWDVAANGMLGAIILPAGPFGTALEATEAIWARMRARSPRSVHLLLPDAPGLNLSDSARGTLPHLEGGSFFVLPPPSSLERLEVLRSVFARLVP
jgi:CheY-like chemotaxis protein